MTAALLVDSFLYEFLADLGSHAAVQGMGALLLMMKYVL